MKKTKMLIIAAAIIVVFALAAYFLYGYINEQARYNEIKEYKKGFYEGILCEYSCPISMQKVEIKNKTQERMLPTLDCIKSCTAQFKTKYANFKANSSEINNDNLIKDMDSAVNICKKKALNISSMTLDNAAYFKCASESLENLKINYSYLNY